MKKDQYFKEKLLRHGRLKIISGSKERGVFNEEG